MFFREEFGTQPYHKFVQNDAKFVFVFVFFDASHLIIIFIVEDVATITKKQSRM